MAVKVIIAVQEDAHLVICREETVPMQILLKIEFLLLNVQMRHKHLLVVFVSNNVYKEFGDQYKTIVVNRVVAKDVEERIQTHVQSLKNLHTGQSHVMVK